MNLWFDAFQNGSSDETYHLSQKREMLTDRKSVAREKMCDMCGRRTDILDKHEIVSKARTVQNPLQRLLTEHKYLCSILCQTCHEQAPAHEKQTILLAFNISLYGYARVKTQFELIDRKITEGIPFPYGSE